MSQALTPATDWAEQVAEGEDARFAAHAQVFAAIQARKSRKYGAGRTLHRKQLTAAHGTLDILPALPAFARQGLFASPRRFEAWVRLSNGGLDHAPDKIPDIRGFAIRVHGVQGESALGHGAARHQDFLLINQETFAFPKSDEFVAFVEAAAKGHGHLIRYLFRRYGLLGAPARILSLGRTVGRPFGGFACQAMHSAVPMANGPYAVRVRLVPATSNGNPDAAAKNSWDADFSGRLARQDLHWDLQLQPFVNEKLTPIEDASVNWPSPYTTVARLTLPQQDTRSETGQALAREVETGVFDVWQALAEHRPLGDVQRARKVVYFESQKGRGASPS